MLIPLTIRAGSVHVVFLYLLLSVAPWISSLCWRGVNTLIQRRVPVHPARLWDRHAHNPHRLQQTAISPELNLSHLTADLGPNSYAQILKWVENLSPAQLELFAVVGRTAVSARPDPGIYTFTPSWLRRAWDSWPFPPHLLPKSTPLSPVV